MVETVTLVLNLEDGALYPQNWPDRIRQIKSIKIKKLNTASVTIEADQAGLAEVFRRLPFLRRDGSRRAIDARETPEAKAAREAQLGVMNPSAQPSPWPRREPG